jgi:hypothetical protein
VSTVFHGWTICRGTPYNRSTDRCTRIGNARCHREIADRGDESASSLRVDRLLRASECAGQRQRCVGPAMAHLSASLLAHAADLWVRHCIPWLSLLAAIATGTLRGLCLFDGRYHAFREGEPLGNGRHRPRDPEHPAVAMGSCRLSIDPPSPVARPPRLASNLAGARASPSARRRAAHRRTWRCHASVTRQGGRLPSTLDV